MQEGWLCPRGRRINAPWIPQCPCGDTNTNQSPVTGKATSDPWWTDTSITVPIDGKTITTATN